MVATMRIFFEDLNFTSDHNWAAVAAEPPCYAFFRENNH